jgi:glycine betaine/proline transport system substrate-binding protein
MTQHRRHRLIGGIAALALAAAACTGSPAATDGGGGGGSKPGEGKTVNMAIHAWVGYEANAAVVGHVLKELGYNVVNKNLGEEVTWQGFEDGEVDVIIENWGHEDLKAEYITQKGVAVDVGPTGNTGIIGWYVPAWLAEAEPEVLNWENLNKFADKFATTETGNQGQFLSGDPSFVTNDVALVNTLGLDYKVVFAGSETALIESFRTAEEQKQWFIGYFWEPHWFLSQVPLKQVQLPEYTEGCDADSQTVNCEYPEYILDKIVSKTFADEGGVAYEVVKNFTWTNDDQNLVSDYITNQDMTPEQAAAKWAADNEAKWKAWIPAGS